MTSAQPSLFEVPPKRVRSALCCRTTPCGSWVELGTPEDTGHSIQTPMRCMTCGVTGVLSENTERAKC